MKKVRIIMAMLVLLGAAPLAEAQIMVSSTTASTQRIYEKSGREKGWVIRPELTMGYTFHYGFSSIINATFAYQFNPYYTIGAGAGVNIFPRSNLVAIPVFLDFRAYFRDRKWSPFVDLKVGFQLPINEHQRRDYWYNGYDLYTNRISGFLLQSTFGMQYKNFDFGISFDLYSSYDSMVTYEYDNYDDPFVQYAGNSLKPALRLNFAYNLPL